jgi:hypothetical protein
MEIEQRLKEITQMTKHILALDLASDIAWAIRCPDGGLIHGADSFRSKQVQTSGIRFLRFRHYLAELRDAAKVQAVVFVESGAVAQRAWIHHAKRTPKGKTMPAHTPLERKDQPAQDLTAQLDPFFKALWQLSVDLQKSEVRELADKIERALEKKNIVKVSERMRGARHYLAKLKPKAAREPSEVKSDVLH